tara:strand:+ start:343 stop:639 length:297 start_codon:yes stop_codon:yes gene_type:complete
MTSIETLVNNALHEMYEQGTVNGSSNVTDKIIDKCLSEVKNLALLNVSGTLPTEEEMYNEMQRRFDLPRQDDDNIQVDDTQIGYEQCFDFMTKKGYYR